MSGALAIAHRAGNSLAGMRAALELGVDVVECDVHLHRGRLEVRHLKTAGPLPFLWDRWELVPASAPRLELVELLGVERRGTAVMLDVKGWRPGTGVSVARLLGQVPGGGPVLACGRHWPTLDALARHSSARPVLSARTHVELARLVRRLSDPGRPPPYGVSVHRSLLGRPPAEELFRRAALVMTWPVDDLATLDLVLARGVRGVISTSPEVLAAVLARRGGEPVEV